MKKRLPPLVLLLGVLACARERARDESSRVTPIDSSQAARKTSLNSRGPADSYLQDLARFQTKLLRKGPAPQAFRTEAPPLGVREVSYESDGLSLKAWVAAPQAPSGSRLPGIVYFHDGFAFGAEDFRDAKPFLNAGLILMCPTLRGENGNPGNFEMFLAEVRDAKAALAWLAQQPNIDSSHLYAFGHSSGGIISALLSLHDAGIRHSGSAGALYGSQLFDWMKAQVPFALDDPNERTFRLLLGNVRAMRHKHYAFVGASDPGQAVAAAQVERGQNDLLVTETVEGNHLTSLSPAIDAYIKRIKDDP